MVSNREIPGHVHTFDLTGTSEAITFHFRPSDVARDGRAYHVSGWALATVNNRTGELAVQSDWGSWTHRWPVQHVGTRGGVPSELKTFVAQLRAGTFTPTKRTITLLEFIGERNGEYCDYLADKLTSYKEREQFDPTSTVREMRQALVKRRVEAARSLLDYGHLDHVKVWYCGREEEWPIDKETVRSIYDELGEIEHEDNVDRFLEAFHKIKGHEFVTTEPWEWLRHRPSPHYYQLLHGILPALVRACAARAKEKA